MFTTGRKHTATLIGTCGFPFWIVLVNFAIGQHESLRKPAGLLSGLLGVALVAWRGASGAD